MNKLEKYIQNIIEKYDQSDWVLVKFGDIANERKESCKIPALEGINRFVGLEHLKPLDLHIRSWGDIENGTTFTRKFKKGDVLFGKRRAYQRKAALAEFDGICSGDIVVMEANKKMVEQDLLPFIVHSEKFYKWAVSTSAGSLSPRTKFKHLAEFRFRLPPPVIQKKIVALLWGLDDIHERVRDSLISFHEYKKVFLEQELLTQDGEVVSFKEMGDVIRGVGYKPTDVGTEYSERYFPLLRSNNIQENGLIFEDLYYINKSRIKETQLLQKADIVICMSNGSKELVGKAAVFESYGHPVSFGSFCAAYRPNNSKYSKLTKYLFQTDTYRRYIKLLLTGSNINNLKPSDIESINFRISKKSVDQDMEDKLVKLDIMEQQICSHLEETSNLVRNIVEQVLTI